MKAEEGPTSIASAAALSELVARVTPFDAVEANHRAQTLSWFASTGDVFRRKKPATPTPHLVSYFMLLDRAEGRALLVEHRRAGLWLPPGGHVEPAEHPVQTVRREAREELGIDVELLDGGGAPFFLTRTQTVGENPHTDVSLWFQLRGAADTKLAWDRGEFASIRWWTPAEIRSTPLDRFDPHLPRFLSKLDAAGAWQPARGRVGSPAGA